MAQFFLVSPSLYYVVLRTMYHFIELSMTLMFFESRVVCSYQEKSTRVMSAIVLRSPEYESSPANAFKRSRMYLYFYSCNEKCHVACSFATSTMGMMYGTGLSFNRARLFDDPDDVLHLGQGR